MLHDCILTWSSSHHRALSPGSMSSFLAPQKKLRWKSQKKIWVSSLSRGLGGLPDQAYTTVGTATVGGRNPVNSPVDMVNIPYGIYTSQCRISSINSMANQKSIATLPGVCCLVPWWKCSTDTGDLGSLSWLLWKKKTSRILEQTLQKLEVQQSQSVPDCLNPFLSWT